MRRWVLWLVLAAVPASVFLVQDGFFQSSDGMIHLYRLFELDRSFHAGIFYPRWFPLSGYGYGLPVLNYYPPLSYFLAELFHLAGAGYIAATKLVVASGFILALVAMFVFARDWLDDGAAFVAAIAFAYSPYLLSDAYVRGNFPEMLALAQMPLALWAFGRVFTQRSAVSGQPSLIAALTLAAIVLTHHLTAMLFAALLLAYLVFLYARTRDLKKLLAAGAAIALGLASSAFYWIPSLAELNEAFVGPASAARFLVNRLVELSDFFQPSLAYAYLPQTEALKHAFGFPQTILALLAGVFALVSIFRRRNPDVSHFTFYASRYTHHVLFWFVVVVASIAMMLTFSAPLWYAIPSLRFMQFPWRFQMLASVGSAVLIGVSARWMGDAVKFKWLVYAAFAFVLAALALANLPVRVFPLMDAQVDLTRADDPDYVVAQMGWGWTREFVPAAVQELDNIPAPIAKPAVSLSPSNLLAVQITDDGLLSRSLSVSTAMPLELSAHSFFYPGWQGYVDGAPVRTFPRGSLGLVSVAVPAGNHVVIFRFEDTPFRRALNFVSLIVVAGVMVWLFGARRRVFVIVIAGVIGIVGLTGWHTRDENAPTVFNVQASLERQAMLIGYTTDCTRCSVGDTMLVTLHWLALNEMSRDYFSFVHLVNMDGNVVAQHDSPTDQGLTPTTRWIAGEMVSDRHVFALDRTPPGEYRLIAGMYFPLENGFQNLGEPVELGRIQLRNRGSR